ncbi:hypothetical protein BDZ89DRAFT_1043249 [Hymenopellis radicata]|nr:hypothetical protein BDZ89DRAFT_1043249 [Hymenopellis radicata]
MSIRRTLRFGLAPQPMDWFNPTTVDGTLPQSVIRYLEQGQRLENLSWRLWHLQNLIVDADNAKSRREFKKLSKVMGDKVSCSFSRYSDDDANTVCRSIEELEEPDFTGTIPFLHGFPARLDCCPLRDAERASHSAFRSRAAGAAVAHAPTSTKPPLPQNHSISPICGRIRVILGRLPSLRRRENIPTVVLPLSPSPAPSRPLFPTLPSPLETTRSSPFAGVLLHSLCTSLSETHRRQYHSAFCPRGVGAAVARAPTATHATSDSQLMLDNRE